MDFGGAGAEFEPYDDLFRKHRVDLYVCGHEHSYQRVRPRDVGNKPLACSSADLSTYTDCGAYVTLVVGGAGNKEMIGILGELDKFEHAGDELMDAFTINYGWSLMTVHNETTLSFVYEVTGTREAAPPVGQWDAWKLVKTKL
jgi:hypothetical protein